MSRGSETDVDVEIPLFIGSICSMGFLSMTEDYTTIKLHKASHSLTKSLSRSG